MAPCSPLLAPLVLARARSLQASEGTSRTRRPARAPTVRRQGDFRLPAAPGRAARCDSPIPDQYDARAPANVPRPRRPPDRERLQELEHHTDLGSGYRIALRDLELRG